MFYKMYVIKCLFNLNGYYSVEMFLLYKYFNLKHYSQNNPLKKSVGKAYQ